MLKLERTKFFVRPLTKVPLQLLALPFIFTVIVVVAFIESFQIKNIFVSATIGLAIAFVFRMFIEIYELGNNLIKREKIEEQIEQIDKVLKVELVPPLTSPEESPKENKRLAN